MGLKRMKCLIRSQQVEKEKNDDTGGAMKTIADGAMEASIDTEAAMNEKTWPEKK